MYTTAISVLASQSAQTVGDSGIILEKWQYLLAVFAAAVSGPFTAWVVHGLQGGRSRKDRRKETGEKVIKLLGSYEVTRLNAYFSYLSSTMSTAGKADQSWLNYQSELNSANVDLREVHGIIKLWMPDDVSRKSHKLIRGIDKLLNEGMKNWSKKLPSMTYEELPFGASYEKQYDDLVSRIREWIDTDV